MALTYTPEAEIGSPCKDFRQLSVDGKTYQLDDFKSSKALVIMFICNHCPYVIAIEDRIVELSKELTAQGAQFVAVCSNDAENYPEDSFENLKKRWQEKDFQFPYLFDEDQKIAKDFGAVCTPDFFVYDEDKKLTYRGRLDDSWKEPEKVQKQELKEAIVATLNGQPVTGKQNPSMGCSIKWVK